MDRVRLTARPDDTQLNELVLATARFTLGVEVVPMVEQVLWRASQPMPVVVRALDAIHLATAVMLREDGVELVFATHDRQQGIAALAMGLEVVGVIV